MDDVCEMDPLQKLGLEAIKALIWLREKAVSIGAPSAWSSLSYNSGPYF